MELRENMFFFIIILTLFLVNTVYLFAVVVIGYLINRMRAWFKYIKKWKRI